MNILAIIPARAGSKRLPGKNIKSLCEKPLIQWTIDAALACPFITKVMVSTDGDSIAEASIKAGAEVPFLRPPELSSDTSTTADVIKHTLNYYQDKGETFDFVLLLQPTSPLRTAQHINEAISLLIEKQADAVISVCSVEHSPLWANTIDSSLSMATFIRDELKNTRSQDLPPYYRINGAIYLTRVTCFLDEGSLFISSNIYAYKMDSRHSIDIDEEIDFLLAEIILKNEIIENA